MSVLPDADQVIQRCLDLDNPTSFFLYAGAGSGKTYSLVEAVRNFKERASERLRVEGRQIAVITYTNAAAEEVMRRLEHDPLVWATIHSFAWERIRGFNDDIRAWIKVKLANDIADLEGKLAKAWGENKTYRANKADRDRKLKRLENIDHVFDFTYSPTGENRGHQALSHSDVIGLAADFIQQRPLLDVLVDKHPVLLIDESQDTMARLMEAFLVVQAEASERCCLGLLGDTMQSIYGHGMQNLACAVPEDWAKPAKVLNRRCPVRVVELIDAIRAQVDTHQQSPRHDAPLGTVRMYCVRSQPMSTFQIESEVARRMADVTGDSVWNSGMEGRKTLILEHKMASRRMGFDGVFVPLYQVDHLRTGLLDGTLPVLRVFIEGVMPILDAAQIDSFKLMEAVRLRSPLLARERLAAAPDQALTIAQAGRGTEGLLELFANADPLISDVVRVLAHTHLLDLSDRLRLAFEMGATEEDFPDTGDREALEVHAYRLLIGAPFSQLTAYAKYCSELSSYGTHQGVKGLEFPRVMVIIDDKEATGFLWHYEKAPGVAPPSPGDLQKEAAGEDNALTRTRRLLCVTCSRAQESFAIVFYTADPEGALTSIVKAGWLHKHEISII
ncbi:AAA family ATPase [Pseudomonas sp. CFBP 8770]|uniref:UvrD-helicase domain-containing protein n=1 Tax=unclassified Pseudomonas TaxID=196821 RepID=UPI0017840504|nr:MULTISPECIES: UvrD-helicase domain-containing protein [unclassified Pseudomonas]MBD8476531.1 AAA family ATPase [Pseudomonas sp. CFBP 8773]MBD8649423.1 AAA family ATPase [Pseudomonas sp. CFBP 8770]